MNDKLKEKIWVDPVYFVAFGFGSGLLPKAPGTWGTLAAIPVYLLIAYQSHWIYFIAIVLAFILGVKVCEMVTQDLGEHDYPGIVWDEMVGYWLTMFLIPPQWPWMLVGFILFRGFDIWKPGPIRWMDKHIKGGLGIMLDDVAAAIPAWLILSFLKMILGN